MIRCPTILYIPSDPQRYLQLQREFAKCEAILPEVADPSDIMDELSVYNAVTLMVMHCLLMSSEGKVATAYIYAALMKTQHPLWLRLEQYPEIFPGICTDIDQFCQGRNLV